ncbi:MAG: RNA polymerase sigma factor [Phycisphaerae bacterium]|nr:RNA polymerase sigma factor [Phycisphaerae bacterium]
MGQSDEALMQRISEGDEPAFEALMERYQEPVRQQLLRMLRDQTAADDLAQEVFLRVWTRAEQWNGAGPLRAWLLRVATNLTLNHLRSIRRRRQTPLQPPREPDDDETEPSMPGWMVDAAALGPDALAEQAERGELVRRLLAQLSDDKREVLRMVHEDQLPLRDVAERLGVPEGTVKSRLHYALRRLAAQWHDLEKQWED